MALDGDTPDHVALQAIRDALDRAGLGAKQSVEVLAKQPEPWEEMMMDFARTSRERQAAMERGELPRPNALPSRWRSWTRRWCPTLPKHSRIWP